MTGEIFDATGLALPAPGATVHFVGVGGIGMSGLARMLAQRGYRVTGSDASDSPLLEELRAEGLRIDVGHDARHVAGADLVVATAAVRETNPEIAAAREAGIPVVKRAAVLGLLCNACDCLAVAGTHGKSTTSGMLALSLDRAGADPSFAVGAVVPQLGTNARLGRGRAFVAEADEYDYSFLWLRPRVAIVTNVEHDHPDLFPDLEAVLEAFARFARGIRPGGTLVVSADDPGCHRLLDRLRGADLRVVTFGLAGAADWRVEGEAVRAPGGQTLPLRLRVPGPHNRLNAAAALAAGAALDLAPEALLPGLEEFGGVGRRFEVRGQAGGVTVIDDYAHHPTEIRATIAAARERYPGATVWAIFQPHTYSRTRALAPAFAEALGLADRVVLTPIYAARETDDLGVRSEDVARAIRGVPVEVVATPAEAARRVAAEARPGDVALVLGAGDVWRASEILLRERESRER